MTPRPTTSSSNIFRRALCPGSHAAEDGLEEETSEEAAEGTLLHALAADPALRLTAQLNPEQLETLERGDELEAEVIATIALERQIVGQPFEEGSEKELWLHRGMRVAFPGHCDRWRYYPKQRVLIILDRKFGRIAVADSANNLQLRSYAVQASEEWQCEHVYVAIVQPRVFGPPEIAHYTASDLGAGRQHLYTIIDGYSAPDAPRRASQDACQYCKARFTCPEHRAIVSQAVPLSSLPVQSLTSEQLGTCLTAIGMLTDPWVSAIRAEARDRIRAGTLPGFALKDNAPRRSIVNAREAFRKLVEAGFTTADLFNVASLNVTGATELYTRSGRKPKEAKQCLELVLGPLIQAKEIEPSIVAL